MLLLTHNKGQRDDSIGKTVKKNTVAIHRKKHLLLKKS